MKYFSSILIYYFLALSIQSYALSDEELLTIRAGYDERRDTYLTGYLKDTFVELDEGLKSARKTLGQADWIWHPESEKAITAPVGKRYFRRAFTLPKDKTLQKVYCAFAADNFADLLVNGNPVGRANGFHQAAVFDVTPHINDAENVVGLIVHNVGDEPNPAGMMGVIHLDFTDGSSTVFTTQSGWRVSTSEETNWSTPDFIDTDWLTAHSLGKSDMGPWGTPTLNLERPVIRYAYDRLTFGLAALYLNTEVEKANQVILESVNIIVDESQATGEFGLHWMGGMYFRLYGLFGPNGTEGQRLTPEVSDAIRHLYRDWGKDASRMENTNPELTWRIWGSENHSAQRDASVWATAHMLATHPDGKEFRYDDGSTAQEQLVAWETYLKRYYRERIKRGMLIEISPSGYGSRTLQGWHNIYDFTTDPELKSLVKAALDVWWTEWAQEQLGGMRGGGKTRLYKGVYALSNSDRNRAMSWFYLGVGKPAHQHETLPIISTTTYRLPLVVMDIALDPEGRGTYEAQSRRLGRHEDYGLSQSLSKHNEPIYTVDAEYGGIIKYSYCTPDFIMGTLMLENRPIEYWTAISQQNRWHGVIFSGEYDSTIYPRCDTDRSTYNGQWSAQSKGTLIAQKLRHSDHADAMRVCFSTDLTRHEEKDWIFAEAAGAYAAVRVVRGGYQWDDERWIHCNDEYSPVIIEVVRKQDYGHNFEAFKQAIFKQDIQLNEGVLRYKGLRGSGDFTFYADSEQTPEINGAPINFAPKYTFKSPFLNEDWVSGMVRIAKGTRELIIDVREK